MKLFDVRCRLRPWPLDVGGDLLSVLGERTFVRDVHVCSGDKVNVSARRVQV